MAAPRRLFIAATNQHVGKTTATLGLIASLQQYGIQVGYCKPLGQKYVLHQGIKVDKDAPIFTSFLKQELIPKWHSPVIMSAGLTCRYLTSPESFGFQDKIKMAAEELESKFDTVIYEGTGHPGVGSVFDMSNADTAAMLGAGVVMVVEAGVGRTIDQICLNKAFFDQKGIDVVGVIINKAIPDKIEKISRVVGCKLASMGIPLLGVIPYEKQLTYPILEAVEQKIDGLCFTHREGLGNTVKDIISFEEIKKGKDPFGKLLVMESCRFDQAVKQLTFDYNGSFPLAGIVLTGEQCLSPDAIKFINQFGISTMFTEMSTFQVVAAFSSIKPKLSSNAMRQAKTAAIMVSKHLDLTPILSVPQYA